MTNTQNTQSPGKKALCAALVAFIAQRSGIEYANYGERASFMADYRQILKAGRQARELLRFVEMRDSITAEMLLEASDRAFSGRLQFKVRDDGKVAVDYTTGQYFATEYRNAACAVLAATIWDWLASDMPKGVLMHNSETGETLERYDGLRAGDWIRRAARRALGRSLANAWFN
jgi:hypothetical protein